MYDPNHSFGFLLGDVTRLLRQEFNQRAQTLGLSQAQWRAMVFLARDEGIHQARLAEILDIAPMTLARLIDHLASSKWVERRPDPGDRRAFCLYLTTKGHRFMKEVWQLAEETRDKAFAGVSQAEIDAMTSVLEKVKANLTGQAQAISTEKTPSLETELQ